MNFVADENIDRQIVDRLREDGHKILYILEMSPGISDKDVLDLANKEAALLITADRDFGELVFRLKRINSGVVLLRLAGLSPNKKAEIVSSAISHHFSDLLNAFSVIAPGIIRIRANK